MAKVSCIERNKKRERMVKAYAARRALLRQVVHDRTRPLEERFGAQMRLSSLPRNASPVRVRNRCELTGRGRSFYRKFRVSRIVLRSLASQGLIPGVVKSSW